MDISEQNIKNWITAWTISRGLPLPTKYMSGYKVELGYEHQKTRYVFPKISDDLIRLSRSINDPWIYLKVCDSLDKVRPLISDSWSFQPQAYMMISTSPMRFRNDLDDPDYSIEFETYNSVYVVRLNARNNEPAAIGRLVLVNNLAVYDRIFTHPEHRRKGLASHIMRELESLAIKKGNYTNFLVATEDGKCLYESLNWSVYCPYSSMVILGKESDYTL